MTEDARCRFTLTWIATTVLIFGLTATSGHAQIVPITAPKGVPSRPALRPPADGDEASVDAVASPGPARCFAPGTSVEYVEQVARLAGENSLQPAPIDRHRLAQTWTATATNGGGLTQGDPITLTWSYVPDGTQSFACSNENTRTSGLFAWLNSLYPGGFDEWHALFRSVFARWSEVAGINYVYEPNDDGTTVGSGAPGMLGVRGDVRISAHRVDGNSGILACNNFPSLGGDMVLDANDSFFASVSNYSRGFRNVVSHEHGHGLGLSHVCPGDNTKLMEPLVNTGFEGPQEDDVRGANRGYGDWAEDNDTIYEPHPFANRNILRGLSLDHENAGDVDVFHLNVLAPMTVSATIDVALTPTGSQYAEGSDPGNLCSGAVTPVRDFSIINDPFFIVEEVLWIQPFPTFFPLAIANSQPRGAAESVNGVLLPAGGDYFLIVGGNDTVDEDAQMYDLRLQIKPNPSVIAWLMKTMLDDGIFDDGFESGTVSYWSAAVP